MLNLKLDQLSMEDWLRVRALSIVIVPVPDKDCGCGNKMSPTDLKRQLFTANFASQLYDLDREKREILFQHWEYKYLCL